ncbi:MAG: hypothetical protein SCH71_10440 [Desulfobulbaceae bacterium]|nr:hypothetical protein [Desulfobulbaceae bacterium]
MHFSRMIPGLGEQFDIEIKVVSKPRHEYQSASYAESGLPRAPAIMIGDEVIVVGADIDEADLHNKISRHLHRI